MLVCKPFLASNTQSLAVAATTWIVPDAVWEDNKGQKIGAHGGAIVKEGNAFYWVG
jgi:hypothetical protein